MNNNNDLDLVDLLNDLTSKVEINLTKLDLNPLQFREKFLDSSSSDSSSSSSTLTSDSECKNEEMQNKKKIFRFKKPSNNVNESDEDDDEEAAGEARVNKTQKYLKTKGELTIDDLQPVAKLNINIDNTIKLVKMGKVLSIVDDKLVVIQSLLSEPVQPLDEESVLFDENRKCLGKIFEIFGPVTAPFYSIRFNNSKEIKENDFKLVKDSFIYYAPDSHELTKFIFNIDEMRQLKGSDASWNNDNEPPAECLDYSDDEKEQLAKKLLKQQNRKIHENLDADDDSDESATAQNADVNANNKKFRNNSTNNNNNKYNNNMSKSRSTNSFNKNNNSNRPRPQMSQSRSEYNFPGQQQQQQFYPPPPPHMASNQFIPPPPYYGYPPQPFYAPNQFMNYPPQMAYFPPGFNYMPPMPPQQQQQQYPPPQFNNFQHSNNTNNSSNSSPSKLVDKRFVQNNLVKKSF